MHLRFYTTLELSKIKNLSLIFLIILVLLTQAMLLEPTFYFPVYLYFFMLYAFEALYLPITLLAF